MGRELCGSAQTSLSGEDQMSILNLTATRSRTIVTILADHAVVSVASFHVEGSLHDEMKAMAFGRKEYVVVM
jgi:hypothetical protein